MNKKSVKDVEVRGKRVFVRCDFNVPMKDGVITSDKRIAAAIPTIQYLLENGAKVILCSHMGKPHNIFTEGFGLTKKEKKAVEKLPEAEQAAAKAAYLAKAGDDQKKLTLKPVADRLNEYLGNKVTFATDIIGEDAKAKVAALKEGEAVLLENVRFDAREEKNGADFAEALASMADLFVNDAFGTAHRAHASTEGISHYIPAVCGFLIEKELEIIGNAVNEIITLTVQAFASSDNEIAKKIRDLGADVIINSSTTDVAAVLEQEEKNGTPVAVSMDCLSGETLGKSLPYMARGGYWVVISTLAGIETTVQLRPLLTKGLHLVGSTLRSRTPAFKAQLLADLVEKVWPKVSTGEVKPTIYKVLPIQEAEAAHDILYKGQNVGKVVLTVE